MQEGHRITIAAQVLDASGVHPLGVQNFLQYLAQRAEVRARGQGFDRAKNGSIVVDDHAAPADRIEHFGELIVVQLLDTGADQQAEDEEHRKQKVPIGEKHQAADDEGRACGIEEIDCLGVREAALDQPVMDVIRIFAE